MAKKRTRRRRPEQQNANADPTTREKSEPSHHDLGRTELKAPKPTHSTKPEPQQGNDQATAPAPEASLKDTRTPLADGAAITDGYKVLSYVGRDAISLHYVVADTNLDTRLSIKEFYPVSGATREPNGELSFTEDAESVGSDGAPPQTNELNVFLRDARALGRLHHPNVVRVHRIFKHNNTTYSVLDNERGEPLASVISSRDKPFTGPEFSKLAARLLSAFAALHEEGVTHGRLQLDDIIIRENSTPVLMNCGTARDASIGNGSAGNTLNGNSAPPDTPPGPWTDIYLLAQMFYRLISGVPPPTFAERAAGATLRPLAGQSFEGYDSQLLATVDAGLNQEARERPASIPEWSHRLLPKKISRETVSASPPSPQAVTRKRGPARKRTPDTATATAPHPPTQSTTSGGLRPNLETVLTTATRVFASIPDIEDESGGTRLPYERLFLVVAIIAGFVGSVLFVTGSNFPLAAVFQVMATLLFFFRGVLPARRFLHNAIPSVETTQSRCSAVTKTTAFMTVATLLLMTVNPFFVERHVGRTGEFPLIYLGIIITFLAVAYAGFALIGTDVKRRVLSFLFGCANWLVLAFCLICFVGIYLSEPPRPIPPPILVNRYFYLFAAASCCCLCFYVYLCRVAAKQRVRQALAMS